MKQTFSIWQQIPKQTKTFDIAIVGGGVIGLSTAFWLMKMNPALSVAVIEARKIGSGASGRNAGFLLQGTANDLLTDISVLGEEKTQLLWQLSQENQAMIRHCFQPSQIDLENSGSWLVAGDAKESELIEKVYPKFKEMGIRVTFEEASKVNLILKSQNFGAGLFFNDNAMQNPVKLLSSIKEASRVSLIEYQPLVQSVQSKSTSLLLKTPNFEIQAQQVLLTMNAYLPLLYPELGALIQPKRAQMFATNPTDKQLEFPIYSHHGYYYLRQDKQGRILMGGARHLFASEEIGYTDEVTEEIQRSLEAYLLDYFPQLVYKQIQYRWSGVMGFSPDHHPIIGKLDAELPIFWVSGFSGHGMGYGFRMGKLLANKLLGNPEVAYEEIFTADRFRNESNESNE